jgi:hypothetical protein
MAVASWVFAARTGRTSLPLAKATSSSPAAALLQQFQREEVARLEDPGRHEQDDVGGHEASSEVDDGNLELLPERPDEVGLLHHPEVDEGAADAPAPALLPVEAGAKLPPVDRATLEQDLPQRYPLHPRRSVSARPVRQETHSHLPFTLCRTTGGI